MGNIEAARNNTLPFSEAEYERRWSAVIDRLDEFGVDVAIATFPRNHQYLTGHNAFGTYAAPYYLIIARNRPRTTVVRLFDAQTVAAESISLDIHTYDQVSDANRVCAEVLRSLELDGARIGMDLGLEGITPLDVMKLQTELPDVKVVDTSRLILSVADVKSEEELDVMRDAMAKTETAMSAFFDYLKEGVTEIECLKVFNATIEGLGARPLALVTFGDRTGLGHAYPGDNSFKQGDVTYLEGGALVHDYATGLMRSAICGRNPEAEALYEVSREALEAAIDAARPGAKAQSVDAAARNVVSRSRFPKALKHRTGYSIGLDWTRRGYTSLEPGSEDVLRPNMTFHMPLILFGDNSQFALGCSETIRVTSGKAEILSSWNRELRFI